MGLSQPESLGLCIALPLPPSSSRLRCHNPVLRPSKVYKGKEEITNQRANHRSETQWHGTLKFSIPEKDHRQKLKKKKNWERLDFLSVFCNKPIAIEKH